MNKLLSQDEVDALLNGLNSGDIETEQEPEELEVAQETEAFKWGTQGSNVKSSMPLLEVVNGRFSQNFAASLSTALRKSVDVNTDPLETIKFGEFQRSLPVPTSMHLFKIEPLRGTGILVIESRLAFSLVETFCGGTGTGPTKIEGRDFTLIEKKLIEKVVHMALMNIMEAWEDVHPIKTEFIRSESNPLVVNVVPEEEPLLSVKYEIELNKPLGKIIVCLPYSSFQPIRHKLTGGYRDESSGLDQSWINTLEDRLRETEVEMSIDLGHAHLSVKDLLNLKEGDIILLEKDFKTALIAKIEGIPKYEGYIGRFNKKKAFRVEQPITLYG